MVGAPYFSKNLNVLRDLGRLAYIAFLQGSKVEADISRIMLKRLTVTGSTLRIRTDAYKAQLARSVETHVWPWIAAGRVRPVVDCILPIAEAEAGHARMQGGDHAGKIILRVSES
jgi:NADPH:quinone reductase-like Zn-dependent oxidoreductase